MKKLIALIIAISTIIPFNSFALVINGLNEGSEIVRLMVELKDEPVLSKNRISSYNLELESSRLIKLQENVKNDIEKSIFGNCEIVYNYTNVFNGFSIDAPKNDIEKIKKLANVENVFTVPVFESPKMMEPNTQAFSTNYEANNIAMQGTGTAIAILDSEFDVTHSVFSQNPPSPKISIADILDKINRGVLSKKNLLIDSLYRSSKMPFVYDYALSDYTTKNAGNIHGTSVASIAAGNNNTFKGAAPNAQLILMKITDDNGHTSGDTMLAALGDATKLGVDVINISVGATAGFSDTSFFMDKLSIAMQIAKDSGIIVTCSAGNDGRVGKGSQYVSTLGITDPLTQYPDYSLISQPASFNGSLAVGACDKSDYSQAQPSWFSSWGATPDLKIKPDITTCGESLLAATYTSSAGNLYRNFSGTSASAPLAAGCIATITEYVNNKFPYISGSEKSYLISQLVMSTAIPLKNPVNGVYYSPRNQGTGFINVSGAVTTPVVLIGDNNNTKINLGNRMTSPSVIKFKAKNLTSSDITYNLNGCVLTDDYYEKNGKTFVGAAKKLNNAVLTFKNGNTVVVPKNSTVEIEATLTLDIMEMLDFIMNFGNGYYIEGFIEMTPANTIYPTLNIPYMGFNGEWLNAEIMDTPVYSNESYYSVTGFIRSDGRAYLGTNRFIPNSPINKKYIAVSNKEITPVYLALLRNARNVRFIFKDTNANTIVRVNYGFINKSYFDYSMHISALSINWAEFGISDGTYNIELQATVDWRAPDELPTPSPDNPYDTDLRPQSLTLPPITVDSQSPVVESVNVTTSENNKFLEVKVRDNHAIQGVILEENGSEIATVPVIDSNANESKIVKFDITGRTNKKYKIKTVDYANNVTVTESEIFKQFIAYYKDNNTLYDFETKEGVITGGVSTTASFDTSKIGAGKAASYKAFIWNENLMPLCSVVTSPMN